MAQNTVPSNNELYCDNSNDEGDELETLCLNSILNISESTNQTTAMAVQSKSSQTKILTTCQFQQTETESKSTYVQFQTATFMKSTRVSKLVNVQNIGLLLYRMLKLKFLKCTAHKRVIQIPLKINSLTCKKT